MKVFSEVILFGASYIAISWFLEIINEVEESGKELDEKTDELFSRFEEFEKFMKFPKTEDILEKIRDDKNKL